MFMHTLKYINTFYVDKYVYINVYLSLLKMRNIYIQIFMHTLKYINTFYVNKYVYINVYLCINA